MSSSVHVRPFVLSIVLAAVPLAACSVDVRNQESGGRAEVDVRTPVGGVSVRTDVDPGDTGLPVYPGARLVQNEIDEPESANVTVGAPWFGLAVVAATFESADPPEKIVEFYRAEMKTYGEVVVCRGDVDFPGERLVCREDSSSDGVQLGVGNERQHRLVDVTPRGGGSRFALVYVRTGEEG